MKILVFISKTTGQKCLMHLISEHAQDDYLFVVSDPNKNLIIDTLKKNNLKYMLLSKTNIELIIKETTEKYDWLLNLWGGYIFKKDILSLAKNSLNIHPSYLPFGRGRDPVVWSIFYEEPAGASLHEISEGVDEGAIYFQEEVKYEFPITGAELYSIVEEKCWKIFHDKWDSIKTGSIKPIEQSNISNQKTNKREDLFDNKTVNLDESLTLNNFIQKILAYDFDKNFSLDVFKNNKKYSIKLQINKIEND